MKTTRERKEERRDGRNVVARRERERAYTPGVTKIGVDSRMDDGQTLGFYDLLTLVRVYRTRCDGHAAPSGENAATFASERILTHPTGSLSDRSISFLLPSSSFPSLGSLLRRPDPYRPRSSLRHFSPPCIFASETG